MYTTIMDEGTGNILYVQKQEEGGLVLCIPLDEGNRHYQEYLEWVAEGNEPEPAGD